MGDLFHIGIAHQLAVQLGVSAYRLSQRRCLVIVFEILKHFGGLCIIIPGRDKLRLLQKFIRHLPDLLLSGNIFCRCGYFRDFLLSDSAEQFADSGNTQPDHRHRGKDQQTETDRRPVFPQHPLPFGELLFGLSADRGPLFLGILFHLAPPGYLVSIIIHILPVGCKKKTQNSTNQSLYERKPSQLGNIIMFVTLPYWNGLFLCTCINTDGRRYNARQSKHC